MSHPIVVYISGRCSLLDELWGAHLLSLLTAVDEQNAQTQEQEGFLLSLSASEEGKELRNEDKISLQSSHSSSYGVSKGRSQRKGIVPGLPPLRSCLQIMILLVVKSEGGVMYITCQVLFFCNLWMIALQMPGLACFYALACASYTPLFTTSLMAGPWS